jgi:heme oxygenase
MKKSKTLKESIASVHKAAEETPLAKKMIDGSITEDEWLTYLSNLMQIHQVIENRNIIEKPEVLRCEKIAADLGNISSHNRFKKSMIEYCAYLQNLSEEKLWAHIYVHYLGHMYGGQFMKKNIKWSSNFLNFEDHKGCIDYIREKTLDVNPKEAKTAFSWIIKLYDEIFS